LQILKTQSFYINFELKNLYKKYLMNDLQLNKD